MQSQTHLQVDDPAEKKRLAGEYARLFEISKKINPRAIKGAEILRQDFSLPRDMIVEAISERLGYTKEKAEEEFFDTINDLTRARLRREKKENRRLGLR